MDYRLANLLYHEGEIQGAFEMAKAALVCNPSNARNRVLLEDLKQRLAEAKPAKQARRIAVQIRCVEKTSETSAARRIQSVGGVNSDGKHWKTSLSDAVRYIENGKYVFYLEQSPGQKLDIVIAKTESGEKYLKATTDRDQPQSLLSLPACP